MLARLLALLGAILVVCGVLKLLGVIAISSATAGTLIVIGVILVLVAEFVLPGGWAGRRGSVL